MLPALAWWLFVNSSILLLVASPAVRGVTIVAIVYAVVLERVASSFSALWHQQATPLTACVLPFQWSTMPGDSSTVDGIRRSPCDSAGTETWAAITPASSCLRITSIHCTKTARPGTGRPARQ